jgi:hypothetical protein
METNPTANRISLTPRAEREMEETWKLRREAVELLGVIAAEFRSDTQSVQCFDLRIVERSQQVVSRLAELEKRNPLA